MTIYDRIRELRISNKMTQTDLALRLGYKDGSMITKIESGKVDISQKKVAEFAEALYTTPAYLMGWTDDSGRSFDTSLTSDERMLVDVYRSLSPRGRALLLDRAQELSVLHSASTNPDTSTSGRVV